MDVPSGRLDTVATVEEGPRRLGAVSERALVRRGPRARGFGPRRRRCVRRRVLCLRARERSPPRSCRGSSSSGRRVKGRARGDGCVRPSARARAPRHLRRHLLAGGGREPADAAQRHGVRRRRGRSLAMRLGHLREARASRRRGAAAARRAAAASLDRRVGVLGRVVGEATVAERPALITEVEGSAYRTGACHVHARPGRPPPRGVPAAVSAPSRPESSRAFAEIARTPSSSRAPRGRGSGISTGMPTSTTAGVTGSTSSGTTRRSSGKRWNGRSASWGSMSRSRTGSSVVGELVERGSRYLEHLCRVVRGAGGLVAFDEVMTGFRLRQVVRSSDSASSPTSPSWARSSVVGSRSRPSAGPAR